MERWEQEEQDEFEKWWEDNDYPDSGFEAAQAAWMKQAGEKAVPPLPVKFAAKARPGDGYKHYQYTYHRDAIPVAALKDENERLRIAQNKKERQGYEDARRALEKKIAEQLWEDSGGTFVKTNGMTGIQSILAAGKMPSTRTGNKNTTTTAAERRWFEEGGRNLALDAKRNAELIESLNRRPLP